MGKNTKTKKIVFLSMMISISLVLHVIESSFPALSFIAPGLRLGLANIVSVVMIYKFSVPEALAVLIIRIVMGSIFGGGPSMFLYSLSGGVLSFLVMLSFKRLNLFKLSVAGISMLGSIFFNIGQMLMASYIIRSFQIMIYLPIMGFASVITGFFVGLVAKYLIERNSLWNLLK